ncbi:MAG: OmpA family protein [Bacteroidaceae bacterium]|nr:OmpA family protein [Bacteroidaceae bacterium]
MKFLKLKAGFLSSLLLLSGCNMSNTAKGGVIGGGGGAAVGALIGALAGKGKGAAIGGAIGAAVGTGAGVLIGNRMDKAAKAAAAIAEAETQVLEDENTGLKYVKVTFDSGILFATGKSELNASAKAALTKFAQNVMAQNPDMDVAIIGYTDNVGFGKQYTAEQNAQKNVELSQKRAQAVNSYLKAQLAAIGASSAQIKTVEGLGEANPVADNSTAAGREQNRRVEVFLVASDSLIKQATEQAS